MLKHYELAQLAGLSYAGPYSGSAALDVRYDLLPRDNELVVVVPGTHPADALDWIRDCRFLPIWLPGLGPVHAGFGSGAEAIWPKMAAVMRTDGLITYAAHSLGGAICQVLGALHAIYRPKQPFRVVTFGAPRVSFMNPWLSHHVRRGVEAVEWARAGDIVPEVPMRPLYWHPTRPKKIGVAADDFVESHSIARYASDLQSLNL